MTKSGIEWTDRSDWNPMRGCTRVSEGCRNCYAERIAGRFSAPGQPFHGFATQTPDGGRWTGKVEMIPDRLDLPLRWKKPSRIFVNSAFDLFHPSVPDELIDRVFGIMTLAHWHQFQVLTKRSDRMRRWFAQPRLRTAPVECLAAAYVDHPAIAASHPFTKERAIAVGARGWPLRNVWLGVSVEDQARADERIPDLLATPAAVRWVSAEPLIGAIDLTQIRPDGIAFKIDALTGHAEHLLGDKGKLPGIDWVVVGGESGPGARPMHPDWARTLRDQCASAGVPFFFKQWGEWAPSRERADINRELQRMGGSRDGTWGAEADTFRVGKARAGRLLDGVEHNGMPTKRTAG